MSIYQLLFELYENGELRFQANGSYVLTGNAFGAIALASGAADPACMEAVNTLANRLDESLAMELIRKHHASAMAKKDADEAPIDHGARLKSALRLH